MLVFSKLFGRLCASMLLMTSLVLQGCSMGGQVLKEADSFKAVADNEVIIVGTIELTPKLSKDEQKLDAPHVIDLYGYGDMNKNRAMIQVNSKPDASGYKFMINPELGKTFFFKISRDMKYIVDGSVMMEFGQLGDGGNIVLPAWFKIDIKPTDKAVYIGKIIYTRDDFNSITSVKLKNDYTRANKSFTSKFGKKYKLRKSLITKIKT